MENSTLRYLEEVVDHYAMLLYTQRRYSNYDTMVAQVRASEPHNLYNRFIIDRGSSHGIMANMPVLADGALVGRVSQVWPSRARVESIIDDVSRVSAKVLRSNHVGTVSGSVDLIMDGLILMEFTSLDADVIIGDEIHTSALSSFYPPGLMVGYVVDVTIDARGMTTAVIKPSANFSPVSFVLIITELFNLDHE
jgi:rod shape-determining protein MreC